MSAGRCVLITGASRGLGRALAEHCLAAGDVVYGCARGESTLTHDRYAHVRADVSREAEVEAIFRVIRDQGGRLDALINNAGMAGMNPAALTTLEGARRIVDANLIGTFLCTRAAIRLLRASSAGRIVNLTTVAVPLRLEGEALYAASKSAVETFADRGARGRALRDHLQRRRALTGANPAD